MNSLNFYSSLPHFSDFHAFTDEAFFQVLPTDWSVIITDIKGSTKAIAEGRYKDVNTIGAATIVVARKALRDIDFPFVFGGDGSTLLVPASAVERVSKDLSSLSRLSLQNYGLELRIGVVPMGELLSSNHSISVGKFEITKGRSIAILRGPGLSYAEKLVKAPASKYVISAANMDSPDLTGLSCRWNPIPSRNGKILTILVSSRSSSRVYDEFLVELSKILPQGIEYANPVNVDLSTYKSFRDLIKEEKRLHRSIFSIGHLLRLLQIGLAVLVFKFKLPAFFFDSQKYSQSMRSHSDFRKFDDTLRMVLDCTLEQAEKIKKFLESKYLVGELFYGTFETDRSLMTCFVDGLGQGEHIHFIDAENGGYAAAAIQLKQQIKKAEESDTSA